MKAVILAAGKSTRLAGENKLLVNAGGIPVHEWHRRALKGFDVGAVVRPTDFSEVNEAMPWLEKIMGHGVYDGPVGALHAYIRTMNEPITVVYGDTLLPEVPTEDADWVAVARAPWRVWDYYDGEWTRGVPYVQVCVGAYRFSCISCVKHIAKNLLDNADGEEVHMVDLIRSYSEEHIIQRLRVEGWQDAGDLDAIARVKLIGD